jgi:hypothetical protein
MAMLTIFRAFVVQVFGAAMASQNVNGSDDTTLTCEPVSIPLRRHGWLSLDLHIYMAGVGMQQLFILVFIVFAIGFHRTIVRERYLHVDAKRTALTLLYVIYAILALITVSRYRRIKACLTVLTVAADAHHISHLRIRKGFEEHDTESRGISVQPRLTAHAAGFGAAECLPSREVHAWKAERHSVKKGPEGNGAVHCRSKFWIKEITRRNVATPHRPSVITLVMGLAMSGL